MPTKSLPPNTSVQTGLMVNLVIPEAEQGPFIMNQSPGREGVALAVEFAARNDCHLIDFLISDPDQLDPSHLNPLLKSHGVGIGAIGSGGYAARYKRYFTHPDPEYRKHAVAGCTALMELGADLGDGVPIIIGSVQGQRFSTATQKSPDGAQWQMRAQAHDYLGECLQQLGRRAEDLGVTLVYELLNGGESNLFETWTRADVFIQSLGCDSIEFLLDSYHWLCEGWSRGEIANATTKIGYVHVVDLARHPIGTFGQATLERLADFALLLKDLNYGGPAIAECLPMPTPEKAMKATLEWIESYFTVND